MSKFVKIFALVATFGFLGNAFANDVALEEHKADVVTAEAKVNKTKAIVNTDKKTKKTKKIKNLEKEENEIKKDEKKLENEIKKDEKKVEEIKDEIKKEEVK